MSALIARPAAKNISGSTIIVNGNRYLAFYSDIPDSRMTIYYPDLSFRSDSAADQDDILVLFTDGVIEAVNKAGEMFGMETLYALVRRHADIHAADMPLAKTAVV